MYLMGRNSQNRGGRKGPEKGPIMCQEVQEDCSRVTATWRKRAEKGYEDEL